MTILPDNIYHIYNQGNNRQQVFKNKSDYERFFHLYKSNIIDFASTIAWCLMPNHFHFMIATNTKCLEKIKQGGIFLDPITNGFRKMLSGYTHVSNLITNSSGSLFRQKTKAKKLSDLKINLDYPALEDYYAACFHYIHQNPLKAKLVSKLEDWEYSSFREYAGLGSSPFCDKELAKIFCKYSPATFIEDTDKFVKGEFFGLFR